MQTQQERENLYRLNELRKDTSIDPDYYNDWEHGFVSSASNQINLGRSLSEKQENALRKIWEKHLKR